MGGVDVKWKYQRFWEVPKSRACFKVKRARSTYRRRYLQDMAQESDSSTPSSSSESGWKCRALATFATKCNNDSLPLDSLWFRRHIKIHDAEVKLCRGPQLFTTFAHFWEKTFWPATIYEYIDILINHYYILCSTISIVYIYIHQ